MIQIRVLQGDEMRAIIDDIAGLRISVFRDWPYLYDGDLEYERDYLAPFAASEKAIAVCAFDKGRLVGVSTAAPMSDHASDFAQAFEGSGLDIAEIYYFAESVLLPDYRGQGIGHRFFDERETYGRRFGFTSAAFCSVIRPADHPKRPKDYVPLDAFWIKRGYVKLDHVIARFSWLDIGEKCQNDKELQFWSAKI